MDKADFLKIYRSLLDIHFYDDVFLADNSIRVIKQMAPFEELENYFVLRTAKNNIFDNRGVEDRENDLESKLITLKEARLSPEKWDLGMQDRQMPQYEEIRPVPVAIDLSSGRSLVLDSNHLLANLSYSEITVIPLVQIVGPNLEKLIRDFAILNR